LTPIGYELGLISEERYRAVEQKLKAIAAELKRLSKTYFSPGVKLDSLLHKYHLPAMERSVSILEFLRRPEVNYQLLTNIGFGQSNIEPDCVEQVEIETKYQGYIERQVAEVERVRRLEEKSIPQGFDYDSVTSFRNEAREKLKRIRPITLGQASRISGVTPADVAILLVHLEKAKCAK
jgi:tRNA uridine 5-carboxymethylaminomethyl modification enzyme